MEWAVRFLFKVTLLVVAVFIGFSFLRQLFLPVEKPVVLAGPGGGGRLPDPLPKGGIPPPPDPSKPTSPGPPAPPPGGAAPIPSAVPLLPPPPVDAGKPITEATHDQIAFRFLDAKTQGNRLTIRLQAVNKGLDRMIEIKCLPWSKTLFYNERGEVYWPQEVQVANVRPNGGMTRAMLVAETPVEILLIYRELPMTAGSLSFRRITLMQLDVSLYSTDQAYRNFFANPIAVSRPTFRMLDIAVGPVASAPGVTK